MCARRWGMLNDMRRCTGLVVTVGALALCAASLARAETYQVGPGQPYATIQETLELLTPGDVVEVQGDATYPGDLWFRPEHGGSADAPVTVRGIAVNGRLPVIQGVGTEEWHTMIVLLWASNFVFEGFEVVGDGNPEHGGIVHKADHVTVRDVIVHDVGSHGLLGTDSESGSLTLERCEFYRNGNGMYDHQIYMATDETMYPGSVFRMQLCYVHDGAGGNNVKSRSARNEIYFNWIEAAVYHELDLIGPDGQDPGLAREDSDVVGNVLIKSSEWRIARIGGDGTGNTAGRYRFVNNTMVLGDGSAVAIGMQQTVESVEMHNNVIVAHAGAALFNHNEPEGADPALSGSHNWLQTGMSAIPETLSDTLSGDDPGFRDVASFDLRPADGSPLVDQGTADTAVAAAAVPEPLLVPTSVPPSRALGTDDERPSDGSLDLGAFELGSGTEPGSGGGGTGAGSSAGGSSAGGTGGGSAADGGGPQSDSGCGCRLGRSRGSAHAGAIWIAAGALVAARRKRERRKAECGPRFEAVEPERQAGPTESKAT